MFDYPFLDYKTITYCLIILILFMFNLNRIIKIYNWNFHVSYALFFWHTIIFFITINLELHHIFSTDNLFFFELPLKKIEPIKLLYPGTTFLVEFVNILRQLEFNYVSINFFFQCIGSLSLIIIYNCTNKIIFFKKSYYFFLIAIYFFLPSISYWSSLISKDTITLFAMSLLIFYFIYNDKKMLLFSIITILTVRPHFVFFILIFFITIFFIKVMFRYEGLLKKFILIGFLYFFSMIVINLLLILSNIDKDIGLGFNVFLMFDNIMDLIGVMGKSYTDTNYAINSKFLPFRFLAYIFGPVMPQSQVLSLEILWIIENFIIIMVLFTFILEIKLANLKYHFPQKLSLLITVTLLLFFLSAVASNFGITMRQKWPHVSLLVFTICYLNLKKENFLEITKSKKTRNI